MSKFGQPPEIFSYDEIQLWPFAYEHEARSFTIHGQSFSATGESAYNHLHHFGTDGLAASAVAEYPLALDAWGHPISTPRFYAWVRDTELKPHFEETKQVIADVFNELTYTDIKPAKKRSSAFEISCGLLREGHLTLSTIGNCACLGVNVDGHTIDYHDWETGYAEYEAHNIDMPAQYISLMAGLGHLATRSASTTA